MNLDELSNLHAAATPGPWSNDDVNYRNEVNTAERFMVASCHSTPNDLTKGPSCSIEQRAANNANVIVALHNAFPAIERALRAAMIQLEWSGHCTTCEWICARGDGITLDESACDCGHYNLREALAELSTDKETP